MKTFIKHLLIISFIFISFIQNDIYKADELRCPYCNSTNIKLISTSATCLNGGYGTFECLNTTDEQHQSPVAEGLVNIQFRLYQYALGHNYNAIITKKATCLQSGIKTFTCKRCQDSYTEVIPITDHKYQITENIPSTCLEDGKIVKKCIFCSIIDEQVISSLGHDYVETERNEPTCIKQGEIINTCTRCLDILTNYISPLGHDASLSIVKDPACLTDGLKEGICNNCNELIQEIIPAAGHNLSNEWVIEKKASLINTGLKFKNCAHCDYRIEEIIPKQKVNTITYVSTLTITSSGILAILFKKFGKRSAKKAVENIATEITKKEILKPSIEEKTILTCIKKDKFYKALKIQKFLKIIECEIDAIIDNYTENEPSLCLIDVSEMKLKKFSKTLKKLNDECENITISLLVSDNQAIKQKELLAKLIEEDVISNYGLLNNNYNVNLVKLILPILKPDLKSDEGLENIGMIADALGIPSVSTIIDFYINGREIKETIEQGKEEGLSITDKATIISDIASILGLETISNVSGLVGDIDDINSSLESKIGGNEISTTKDAVEDIIDVVGELIDK